MRSKHAGGLGESERFEHGKRMVCINLCTVRRSMVSMVSMLGSASSSSLTRESRCRCEDDLDCRLRWPLQFAHVACCDFAGLLYT